MALHLSSLAKAINSGPSLFQDTAPLLRHPNTESWRVASLPERLVMSSLSSSSLSSSSPSSFGSSTIEPLSVRAIQTLAPVEDVVWVDDPEGVVNWSYALEQSSHLLELDWVDPEVTGFASIFLDEPFVSSFIEKYTIMKPDASDGILTVDYCQPTDTICMGWSPLEGPFFFVYSCLFSDLHIALPLDDFTMGVLRTLNVAHSQLHPKTWALLLTFRLICDIFCLSPTPTTFLSYYTSYPTDPR